MQEGLETSRGGDGGGIQEINQYYIGRANKTIETDDWSANLKRNTENGQFLRKTDFICGRLCLECSFGYQIIGRAGKLVASNWARQHERDEIAGLEEGANKSVEADAAAVHRLLVSVGQSVAQSQECVVGYKEAIMQVR